MHSRQRPGGFGSSQTQAASRYTVKPRSDFANRPASWEPLSRETEQPPGYGVNKYSLSNNPRAFDDRTDREEEKMRSEAHRLAAEYFASKGNTSEKLAIRGGRPGEPVPDKYSSYMDPSPPVRDDRRGGQFPRALYEETSLGYSDPKYDSKFDSKFSSYREPEKAAFDDSRYPRGRLPDTRKYDNLGGGRNLTGSSQYESPLPKEPLGETLGGKYEAHYRGSSFAEPGLGNSSYNLGTYEAYQSRKDPKSVHREERERDRGVRGERDRDRDDRGDRGKKSEAFNGNSKVGGNGRIGGRQERNRREEPIPNKRKDRPFESHDSGDTHTRTDFAEGKDVFTKEMYPKDLYSEQQQPPSYMTLLEVESSRRREDPDYGLEDYEYPTTLGAVTRAEVSRHNPPLVADRTGYRETRSVLDTQFREELQRGKEDFRRGVERDPLREPPAVGFFGESDRTLLGLKPDNTPIGGHSFASRGERLPTVNPMYEIFDDGVGYRARVQPPPYDDDRMEPRRLGTEPIDFEFGSGSFSDKEKSRYSSYERDPNRLGEPESLLHSTFDLPQYDKGLSSPLDNRTRSRFDVGRGNVQETYLDVTHLTRPGLHSQREPPGLSSSHRGASGWRGRSGDRADNREPPLRLSLADRLGPLNQDKPGYLRHGAEGPRFHQRGRGDDFPSDRHQLFERRRPHLDFRDRDDRRGRGRGRGSFSPRDGYRGRGGPSPRKFQKWDHDREMPPRPSSQAEEFFRMHNMKAKKPATEPEKKPTTRKEKSPPKQPSPKETSNQDDDSDWDAGLEDKVVEVQNKEPQGDWEAINADKVKTDLKVVPRSEDEKLMDSLIQAQQAACMSSRLFLKALCEDEDDLEELEEDEEEDDDEEGDVGSIASDDDGLGLDLTAKEEVSNGREEKSYEYYVKMFQDNHQLRKLYEEKRNCGLFECLVCYAEGKMGKKKKFPDVVGMVQHSRKITKTKKISEHRGYARAMCYLLGWDAQAPNGPAVRGCIPAVDDGKSTKQEDVKAETTDVKEAAVSVVETPAAA